MNKHLVNVPLERIVSHIFLVRGRKVMLDSSLAKIFGVSVGNLNLSVKRNMNRFPSDFVFQLTKDEHDSLRLQYAISNQGRGGRRYLPYVFTEHGVAMLSSVLKSNRAVQLNISIVRAFIKLREILSTNIELARKIEDLENVQKNQNKHINTIYSIIEKLITSPPKSGKSIGFEK